MIFYVSGCMMPAVLTELKKIVCMNNLRRKVSD